MSAISKKTAVIKFRLVVIFYETTQFKNLPKLPARPHPIDDTINDI